MRFVYVLAAAVLLFGVAGCVTEYGPSSYTCDWCSKQFFVSTCPGEQQYGYVQSPDSDGMEKRVLARTHFIEDDEGHNFCSLKCKNSYLASKDVKEQRTRKIHGE